MRYVLILLLAGCSSAETSSPSATAKDGGTGNGNDATATDDSGKPIEVSRGQACADSAAAVCARLEACSPFGLQASYGDAARCKERLLLGCEASFDLPGTSATPAKAAACAAALPSVTCDDLIAGNLGSACLPSAGTLESGASCLDDAQCASLFCARGPTSACGKCSAPTSANGPCVDGACSRGLACVKGTCIAPVRGKAGDTCTAQEQCDLATAVGCNTQSRKCIPLTIATTSCGAPDISAKTFAVCRASGSCSAVINGTCSPAAADGASCAADGPFCMPPARCVAGKCALPACP